jgi:hypothetical protein
MGSHPPGERRPKGVAPSGTAPGIGTRPVAVALARPAAQALRDSTTVASLLERVRQSEARWREVAGILPPGLAAGVRAGPLDDQAWLLLAEHASAAAKLRQCLPAIEAALAAAGIVGPAVKIKIRPRG